MKRFQMIWAASLIVCTSMFTASAFAQSDETNDVPTNPMMGGDKFPITAPQIDDAQMAQATGVTGTIAIHAIQATPDAPPIGKCPVTVQLVHRGAVIKTLTSELDEHGVVMLENVSIGMGVTPVVRVQYEDVMYQQPGELMDVNNRQQTIEVQCYELTTEKPEWSMVMRHVMVGRDVNGLMVAEIVVINNPGQRTWLGETDGPDKGATCVVPIPKAATNVSLGKGFYDWSTTKYRDGRLVSRLPLMPGSTELQFRYNIPAESGKALIDIAVEHPIDQMMVVIPAELETESVEGIEMGGTDSFGDQQVRYYRSSGLNAGDSVHMRLSGIESTETAPMMASTKSSTATAMKVIVGIAAAAFVILAVGMLLKRRPAEQVVTN